MIENTKTTQNLWESFLSWFRQESECWVDTGKTTKNSCVSEGLLPQPNILHTIIARDWRGLLFNCLGRLLETPTWSVKYLPSNWGVRQTLSEGLRVFCREVVLLQLVLHCDWTVLLLQTKSWTLVCGHVRNSRELVERVCLSHWTTGVFNFTRAASSSSLSV